MKKIEQKKFSEEKFWIGVHVRLAKINQKRTWLSEVTPIDYNRINNQYNQKRWPWLIDTYYIAKALNTTIEELIEDSINND